MEKQKRFWYIFCGVTPVLVYYGVTMLAVMCANACGWSNSQLNMINAVVNIVVLYALFYRKYREIFVKGAIPPLLPTGQEQHRNGRIPLYQYGWIVLLGCGISLFVNNLTVLLHLNEHITTYKSVADDIYSGGIFIVIVRTAVLAACMEELLMRGLFYRCVSTAVGRLAGMLAVNLVFGLLHGNLLQGMYAFVLGIAFSYVYDRYNRNLAASILAHMMANLMSVLGSMVPVLIQFRSRHLTAVTVLAALVCVTAIIGMQWRVGRAPADA